MLETERHLISVDEPCDTSNTTLPVKKYPWNSLKPLSQNRLDKTFSVSSSSSVIGMTCIGDCNTEVVRKFLIHIWICIFI